MREGFLPFFRSTVSKGKSIVRERSSRRRWVLEEGVETCVWLARKLVLETGVFFQTPKDIKDEKKKKSLGSVKLISSDSILSLSWETNCTNNSRSNISFLLYSSSSSCIELYIYIHEFVLSNRYTAADAVAGMYKRKKGELVVSNFGWEESNCQCLVTSCTSRWWWTFFWGRNKKIKDDDEDKRIHMYTPHPHKRKWGMSGMVARCVCVYIYKINQYCTVYSIYYSL